jgi:hypothetical protein
MTCWQPLLRWDYPQCSQGSLSGMAIRFRSIRVSVEVNASLMLALCLRYAKRSPDRGAWEEGNRPGIGANATPGGGG